MNDVLAERYLLETELARGAAGVVYRARDMITGEAVAIKVLHAEAAGEPAVATAFLDEAEVLSELNHPGIVRPRDLIVNGTLMALVMDLVDGVDLRRSILDSGPVAPRRAATMVSEVANALAAVHAKGIVHGDVKPGNILIPRDGGPARLVDFGVARRIASPDAPTHGTPDYTAPEIIEGRPSSAKSDVYGVGLVLYEAVCGVNPYRGGSIDDVLARHRDSVPVRPETVDPELWKLIESCLSLLPADRPDAESLPPMLRAIEKLLPTEPQPALSTPVELRPRPKPVVLQVPGEPVAMTPPTPSAPQTTMAPAVPLPSESVSAKRGAKPVLWLTAAAGVVAVALAGVVVVGLFGGGSQDEGVSTQPQGNEETSSPAGEERGGPSDDGTDQSAPEPTDGPTSADSEDPGPSSDSTGDGDTGDDSGDGSDPGESETDIPGTGQIGDPLPGKPGGN